MKNTKGMVWYDQGDVMLILVKMTKDKKKEWKKLDTNVLREGEHTGHSHRAYPTGKAKVALYTLAGMMYLEVLYDKAKILHQEHNEVILPPGEYEVMFQREYDHFAEEVREVLD